jgi:hypothetical protein
VRGSGWWGGSKVGDLTANVGEKVPECRGLKVASTILASGGDAICAPRVTWKLRGAVMWTVWRDRRKAIILKGKGYISNHTWRLSAGTSGRVAWKNPAVLTSRFVCRANGIGLLPRRAHARLCPLPPNQQSCEPPSKCGPKLGH